MICITATTALTHVCVSFIIDIYSETRRNYPVYLANLWNLTHFFPHFQQYREFAGQSLSHFLNAAQRHAALISVAGRLSCNLCRNPEVRVRRECNVRHQPNEKATAIIKSRGPVSRRTTGAPAARPRGFRSQFVCGSAEEAIKCNRCCAGSLEQQEVGGRPREVTKGYGLLVLQRAPRSPKCGRASANSNTEELRISSQFPPPLMNCGFLIEVKLTRRSSFPYGGSYGFFGPNTSQHAQLSFFFSSNSTLAAV